MKQIISTTLIFCSICIVYAFRAIPTPQKSIPEGNAHPVNWMSWEEATAQQIQDQKAGKAKKLFVDVYTDWCGWCKKMDADVFRQPDIAAYLNTHFYPIKLNAEQKEDIKFRGKVFRYVPNGRRGYHELAAQLMNGKMSYPTVVFLDEEINLIQVLPGYQKLGAFEVILHYFAENHYKKTKWDTFQKEFAQNKLDKR